MKNNNQKTPSLQVVDNNQEPEIDWIEINIPLRLKLWGKRPDAEKSEIAVEALRHHASNMFSHIGYITGLYENKEITRVGMLEINSTLAELGEAVVDAIEVVQMKYEKQEKSQSQAA